MMMEQQGQVLEDVQKDAQDATVNIEVGDTQLCRAIVLLKSTPYYIFALEKMVLLLCCHCGGESNDKSSATFAIYATPTRSAQYIYTTNS